MNFREDMIVPSVPPFDGDVRPGDVRIFADAGEPFVALVLDSRGLLGWRIVPVSPDPTPVSRREVSIGPRVYELWNACTAARAFVERSWLVDTVQAADVAAVRDALPAARPGWLSAGDGPAAMRERDGFAMGGTFRPLARILADEGFSGVLPFAPRDAPRRWWREAVKIAASVAVCLGTFYVVLGPAKEGLRAVRAKIYPVRTESFDEVMELVDADAEEPSQYECDDAWPADGIAVADFALEDIPGLPTVPDAGFATPPAPPPRRAVADARMIAAIRMGPFGRSRDAGFVDPREMPRSILDTGAIAPLASGGAPAQAEESGFPEVEALAAACPWHPYAVLLNVRASGVEPGSVEVSFSSDGVRGYKLLSGGDTRPLNAFYEVRLAGPGPAPDGFCRVFVRRRVQSGYERRETPVRRVEAEELGSIPAPPARPHAASPASGGFASPDDVQVELPE